MGRYGITGVTARAGLHAAVFGVGIVVGATAHSIGDDAPEVLADRHDKARFEAHAEAPGVQAPKTTAGAARVGGELTVQPSTPMTTPAPYSHTTPTTLNAEPPVAVIGAAAGIDIKLATVIEALERLSLRVAALEQLETTLPRDENAAPEVTPELPPPMPVSTPEARYQALISVGVDSDLADDILERQADWQ
jgi:hypothetical protein